MTTNPVATGFMLSICMILVWPIQPGVAQPPETGLRQQLEAILEDDELSRLEQVRQLRKLVEREEAALLQNEVTRWIEELGGAEFSSREMAQKNLIEAGQIAIAAVAKAARRDDRERAERCLTILTANTKGDDAAVVASALDALQQLSVIESPLGRRAAKTLAELRETAEDRALAALDRIGARIHKDNTGDVTSVSVLRGGISDHEMRLLAAFPRMRMLTVMGEGVTDAGLDGLLELKSLRALSLMRTLVSDVGLTKLASLSRLELLTLGGGKITSEGLRKLKDFKSLQTLGLFEFRPTASDIEVLSSLNLRALSLSLRDVGDDDLSAIGTLTNLTSLTLMDSPNLTDAGVANLTQLNLRSLTLPSSKVTNNGLRHLSQMTSLSLLILGGEQITDAGMEHLSGLKNLRIIGLSGTSVSDEGAAKLQAALPGLQQVAR